jgi:poly-beta-1,6-N-acetyl-D-glucosamine synthase
MPAVVQDLAFDLIGNVGADVPFEPDYFQWTRSWPAFLTGSFEYDHRLGVAGTLMSEPGHGPVTDGLSSESDVFGACQIIRRDCFAQIGVDMAIKTAGVDWVELRTARMNGWRTQSCLQRQFLHLRPMRFRKGGWLVAAFRHGASPVLRAAPLARACSRAPRRALRGVARTPRGVAQQMCGSAARRRARLSRLLMH